MIHSPDTSHRSLSRPSGWLEIAPRLQGDGPDNLLKGGGREQDRERPSREESLEFFGRQIWVVFWQLWSSYRPLSRLKDLHCTLNAARYNLKKR